jgi:hypothetical protein
VETCVPPKKDVNGDGCSFDREHGGSESASHAICAAAKRPLSQFADPILGVGRGLYNTSNPGEEHVS